MSEKAARVIAMVGSVAVFLWIAFLLWAWTVDDAFISLRYARNLASGHGLVYSVGNGERVEAYTNFLWVLLEAAIFKLGFSSAAAVTAVKAVGALFGAVSVLLTFKVAETVFGSWQAGGAAALLFALTPYFAFWAVGGLETPLFISLIFASLWAGMEMRSIGLGIMAGVLFASMTMTRPEGGLVAAVLLVSIALSFRGAPDYSCRLRACASAFLVFTAVYAPYFIWRWGYYSLLLPNSFYAKTGGQYDMASLHGRIINSGPFFQLVALATAIAIPVVACRRQDNRLRIVLTMALCLAFVALVPRREHMPGFRYELPLGAMISILASQSVVHLLNSVRSYARVAVVVSLALFLLYPVAPLFVTAKELKASMDNSYIPFALWLRDNLPQDITVAGWDQGAIPYYSEKTRVIETHPEGLLSNYVATRPYKADYYYRLAPEVLLLFAYYPDRIPPRPAVGARSSLLLYYDERLKTEYGFADALAFKNGYFVRVYFRKGLPISDEAMEKLHEISRRSRQLVLFE